MIIRQKQEDVFGECAERDFVLRLIAFLKQEIPDRCAGRSDSELRAICARGVEFAVSYGLPTEIYVARFILLMVSLKVDFDASPPPPWVMAIITGADIPANEGLRRIYERTLLEIHAGRV